MNDDLLALVAVDRADDPEPDSKTTLFVASTEDEDRYNSVVKQDWDLKNWRRNPVILDNHNMMRVVGRGVEGKVPRVGDDAGKLMIRSEWDLDNPDPSIRSVGWQHLNGFRSAGSVRWKYRKVTERDRLDPSHSAFKQKTKQQVESPWGVYEIESAGLFYEGNELLEFSSVSVPGNANALQRSLLAELGIVEPADWRKRAQRVGETVPRHVAADLESWLELPEHRARALDLLWPDVLDRMRTDPTYRRIHRALGDAGPPPAPVPSFEALVLRHLES